MLCYESLNAAALPSIFLHLNGNRYYCTNFCYINTRKNNGETVVLLWLLWYVNGFSKYSYVELLTSTTYIIFRLAMLSAVKSPGNQAEQLSEL